MLMNKSFEDGIMNFHKILEESTVMIKELKAEQLMMEAQIAQLAGSFATWQPDSSPPLSTQIEEDTNTVILAGDEECDSFSICVDDVPIDKEEDHVITNEIDDFAAVVDHVHDDEVKEESNTELVLVSLPSYVPKLLLSTRMDDISKVDQCFGFENFTFTITFSPILENTCFKIDVMSKIVRDDLSQNLLGDPFQKALILQFPEDGDNNIDALFIDLRSQEFQPAPTKVRSSEKPPPEPPPRVNVKRVQSFHGCEFYRCFVTNFSKILKSPTQLLFFNVIIKFNNACSVNFCRIKATYYIHDIISGGETVFEKVDTSLLFLTGFEKVKLMTLKERFLGGNPSSLLIIYYIIYFCTF